VRLSVAIPATSRKGQIPAIIWWTGYLIIALWAQELSGGLDFLSPGVIICLQSGQWWTSFWMAALWVLVQEGGGNLVFGVSILFYVGMLAFFLLLKWLLEPENPLFIVFFSLLLACWSWGVLSGAINFQELPPLVYSPWSWIARQWAAYALLWGAALFIYRRRGRNERI
jgi:hypothetical protein